MGKDDKSMNHAQIDILGEKIVDSFAGGGGTSTGIELAAMCGYRERGHWRRYLLLPDLL